MRINQFQTFTSSNQETLNAFDKNTKLQLIKSLLTLIEKITTQWISIHNYRQNDY